MSEDEPVKPKKNRVVKGQIDISKRYDVHSVWCNQTMVYEDVKFVGLRSIEKPEGSFFFGGFVEMEEASGNRFMVVGHTIHMIHEHGTAPAVRNVK